MKVKLFKTKLWRGLTGLGGVLFSLVVLVTCVAITYEADVNIFMGTHSSELVLGEGEEMSEWYTSDYDNIGDLLSAKRDLIERIQEEGSVLMKNDGALPLASDDRNVTVLGASSVNMAHSGSTGGSSIDGNTDKGADKQIVDLKTAFEERGLTVNPKMWNYYLTNTNPRAPLTAGGWNSIDFGSLTIGEMPVSEYPADNGYSEYNGAAIVVITRQGAEGTDFAPYYTSAKYITDGDGVHTQLQIHQQEWDVINHAAENFDKVIVLINSDNVMQLEELEKSDNVDAILWIGSPGTHGLRGVADILTGEANPSGRTVDTWAANINSSPAVQNFYVDSYANAASFSDIANSSNYIVYAEGIYVGYRYYETRYEDVVLGRGNADSVKGSTDGGEWSYEDEMTYPFGYGLSYTTFEQEFVSMEVEDGIVTAQVKVTNTGDVAGKDVVELYLQAPYNEGGIEKSAIQLAAYAKTDELEPGGLQTVTIEFDMRYAASYDYEGEKTYVLEAGDYLFTVGANSHDALNNILAYKGKTVDDGMDYNGNADLVQVYTIYELDKTYSKSVTGADIINRFDDADLNYWIEDSVTYLTRSDWNTFPEHIEGLAATEDMIERLRGGYEPGSSDTSSIIQGWDETDIKIVDMMGKDYDDPDWENLLNQLTLDEIANFTASARTKVYDLPSITFQGPNGRDGSIGMQTNYVAEGTDPETGYTYAELSPIMFNSSVVQASTWSEELMTEQGEMYGNDSLWTDSYCWQRAPGLDLHRTPYCGRTFEYFSEDPVISYTAASAQIKAAQSEKYGLIMSPKHLAFNEMEVGRKGLSTFFNEQAGRELYLRAFEGAFTIGGAKGTMTTYNRIGLDAAPESYALNTEILREEWGFVGINITDFWTNNTDFNVRAAIMAGSNCVCSPNTGFLETGLGMSFLSSDAKLLSTLRERVHEMLYTFANSNAMNGHTTNAMYVSVTPWWKAALIAIDVVLGVVTVGAAGMYVASKIANRGKEEYV